MQSASADEFGCAILNGMQHFVFIISVGLGVLMLRPHVSIAAEETVTPPVSIVGFKIRSVECASGKCVLQFVPEPDLHFNLKAPNLVSEPAKIVSKNRVDVRAEVQVGGQLAGQVGGQAEKSFNIRLFVCDEKETFCAQKDARVVHDRGGWEMQTSIQGAELEVGSPKASESSALSERGFSDNNLALALREAKKRNRLVLLDFSAIWCPACLRLEEEVFESAEFKKMAGPFIKVRIDSDWRGAAALKERYHIRDMPTLVVVDGAGDERTRFHGFRVKQQMVRELQAVLANRPASIESLRKKADAGDLTARDRIGVAAFDALKLKEAIEYLKETKRERLRLLSAELETATENGERLVALHELRTEFPLAIDAPRWWLRTAELSPAALPSEPDSERESAAREAIKKAAMILKKPERLKSEFSVDPARDEVEIGTYELLAIQAEAAQLLKQPDEAQKFWSLAINDLRGKLNGGGQSLILVRYLKKAGREAEIPQVLREASAKQKDNYVFDYKLAGVLSEKGFSSEAEGAARSALAKAYAENRGDAALQLASILKLSSEPAKLTEARELAKRTLSELVPGARPDLEEKLKNLAEGK